VLEQNRRRFQPGKCSAQRTSHALAFHGYSSDKLSAAASDGYYSCGNIHQRTCTALSYKIQICSRRTSARDPTVGGLVSYMWTSMHGVFRIRSSRKSGLTSVLARRHARSNR
jgi:hypothetical protein